MSFAYEFANRGNPMFILHPQLIRGDRLSESSEDSDDPQEDKCPFCCYLFWHNGPFKARTPAQRIIFHEKCQSCSSPDEAQISLCDFCKHLRWSHLVKCIWRDTDTDWKRISIDLDPKARAQSRTKCDLCDFLADAISLPQTGPSEDKFIVPNFATLVICRSSRGIRSSEDGWNGAYSIHLMVHDDEAPIESSVNFGQFVDWQHIRSWLRNYRCLSLETSSKPTFPPGFKVIDVNRRCVIEQKDFCEYMALSYVWGTRSASACYVEQATRDNIESLKVPGGLTQLPETIEDSITMCQKLGIKYLWVDRYCIVQDHAVQKHTQIAAMADIYSFSTVTVIACSGKNGVESGIPGVRRERQLKRRHVNIQGITFSYLPPQLEDIVPKSIWNTRGWTYQEAILSRRRLIMTPWEAWFQCEKGTFREHCSDDWDSKSPQLRTFTEPEASFRDYSKHLTAYTKRKLGYASDIYNAFDGIARALYEERYAFHFGLPESDFDQSLLWCCGCIWNEPGSRSRRICTETTPSWSWASITCQVIYDDQSFCMPLVKWVLYKTQAADMSSPNTNPESHGAHGKELKAIGEPYSWSCWRTLQEAEGLCPQLFLAFAVKEGCIKVDKHFTIPEHESFSSLKANFTRRWPTYTHAYEEIRQVDTRQSSGSHGVLFTNAQSAFFDIDRRWIKNANGMDIGSLCQMYTHEQISHKHSDGGMMWNGYEGCSNCTECSTKYGCKIEGIALSISGLAFAEISGGEEYTRYASNHPPCFIVPKRTERSMIYFDCNGHALDPVPVVNVMFIRREDGYARRIGLGWIALKQWGSVEWRLEDIWLK